MAATTAGTPATAGTRCGTCGGPVSVRGRGRPAKFCSAACKARAYRARRARKASGAAGGAAGGAGPDGVMSGPAAARLAAFHAAAAIESALANGWETLDRYGEDRPRVEAALNDLRAELDRRAREPAAATPATVAPPTPVAAGPQDHRRAEPDAELNTVLAALPAGTRPVPSVAHYDRLLTDPAVAEPAGGPVGNADAEGYQDDVGRDDAAGRRQEEERRWRRALRPIGADVAGAEGYRGALWPDEWGRYHVAAPGGERLGYVEKERTGWEARDTGSHLIDHRLRTRARAVAVLVRRHRERTPHSDAPVDGLPDGWRLTQTLAGHEDGRWRLIAPGGEIAGTIGRVSYGGRRAEWRATTGDPGRATAYRTAVLPDAGDPARGSDSDLWRTRAAAVRALAAWRDPELDLVP